MKLAMRAMFVVAAIAFVLAARSHDWVEWIPGTPFSLGELVFLDTGPDDGSWSPERRAAATVPSERFGLFDDELCVLSDGHTEYVTPHCCVCGGPPAPRHLGALTCGACMLGAALALLALVGSRRRPLTPPVVPALVVIAAVVAPGLALVTDILDALAAQPVAVPAQTIYGDGFYAYVAGTAALVVAVAIGDVRRRRCCAPPREREPSRPTDAPRGTARGSDSRRAP